MYGLSDATLRFTAKIDGIMVEIEVRAENIRKLNAVLDAMSEAEIFDEVI